MPGINVGQNYFHKLGQSKVTMLLCENNHLTDCQQDITMTKNFWTRSILHSSLYIYKKVNLVQFSKKGTCHISQFYFKVNKVNGKKIMVVQSSNSV